MTLITCYRCTCLPVERSNSRQQRSQSVAAPDQVGLKHAAAIEFGIRKYLQKQMT